MVSGLGIPRFELQPLLSSCVCLQEHFLPSPDLCGTTSKMGTVMHPPLALRDLAMGRCFGYELLGKVYPVWLSHPLNNTSAPVTE